MNENDDLNGPAAGRASSTIRTWRLFGWGAALVLLLAPLIAMQFTEEVQWKPGDFLIFGALLATAGGLLEWLLRLRTGRPWRVAAGLAVLAGFVLVWAQGAVGLVGDGDNAASLAILAGAAVAIAGGLYALSRRTAEPQ